MSGPTATTIDLKYYGGGPLFPRYQYVDIVMISGGGGGAGFGGTTQARNSGGGGGGALVMTNLRMAALSNAGSTTAQLTVSVGYGGARGGSSFRWVGAYPGCNAAACNGEDGGATEVSFSQGSAGAVLRFMVPGGGGGVSPGNTARGGDNFVQYSGTSTSTPCFYDDGDPTTECTRIYGTNGSPGTTAVSGAGGAAGSVHGGTGGPGVNSGNGTDGLTYGGGGGAGFSKEGGNPNAFGGYGAPGLVLLTFHN